MRGFDLHPWMIAVAIGVGFAFVAPRQSVRKTLPWLAIIAAPAAYYSYADWSNGYPIRDVLLLVEFTPMVAFRAITFGALLGTLGHLTLTGVFRIPLPEPLPETEEMQPADQAPVPISRRRMRFSDPLADAASEITRIDILLMNLEVFGRTGTALIGFLGAWLVGLLFMLYFGGFEDFGFARAFFGTLLFVVCVFIVGGALCMALVLALAGSAPGLLGRYEYLIVEDGFVERTSQTDRLVAWSDIHRVFETPHYIAIRNASDVFHFHAVPKRAFRTKFSREAFLAALDERIATA